MQQTVAPVFGIEEERWFAAAREALAERGFTVRVTPRSIIVEHAQRLPRVFGSARDMLEFAVKLGIAVPSGAFLIADLYGDGHLPPLDGRRTASPFETPPDRVSGPDQAEQARYAAEVLAHEEYRVALENALQAAYARAEEAEKQCQLWQLSASAAEQRVASMAEALEAASLRGNDRRFEQLKRFLARELHPDLAGADAVLRAAREETFKRVWAKIDELQ